MIFQIAVLKLSAQLEAAVLPGCYPGVVSSVSNCLGVYGLLI